MAFKIALTPSYKVKVTVETPNDSNGFDRSTFTAEFKRVSTDQLDEIQKKTKKEVVDEVLVGFSDLVDEDNKSVEYNDETRAALLAIPQAVKALADGFLSSIFNAKEKN